MVSNNLRQNVHHEVDKISRNDVKIVEGVPEAISEAAADQVIHYHTVHHSDSYHDGRSNQLCGS